MSIAPPRSSLPPPSLPRALLARTRISSLREELSTVPDPRTLGLLELELGALHEHGLGDREQAIDCYLRARHHQPGLLPALFGLARIYADKGAPAEAAETWQALAEKSPLPGDRAASLCEAGLLSYDQLGERERAVELWGEALQADPSCVNAALLLEQHHRATGNTKDADLIAGAHARALGDHELAASILVELALGQEREGSSDGALTWLQRASELGVGTESVHRQIERIARKHGQKEKLGAALEALGTLFAKRASQDGADGHRAAALLRQAARPSATQGRAGRDSLEIYARALALKPNDPLLLWERLLAQSELGDAAAATLDARALLDAGVDGPLAAAVRVRLARLLQSQAKPDEALRELQVAMASEPGSAAATAALEDALLKANDLRALREHLIGRAERSHGQARAEHLLHAGRVALLEASDGRATALDLFRQSVTSATRPEPMLRAVYGAAVLSGAWRAAVAAADTLCTSEIGADERAMLRFDQYRRLLRALGDAPAALDLLTRALPEGCNVGWAPHAAVVQAGAARNYRLLASAHAALAAQIGDEAASAAHLCAAARALLRAGEPEAAAEELRRALERSPDDAYALALLEECLLSSGGEHEVARMLRETARKHASAKQRELGLLHAGFAAEAIGDVQAAARAYEEAAEHDSTSLGPRWALSRLAERSNDAALFERALSHLAQREEHVGGTGLCNLELGELLSARGRVTQAVAPLGAALGHADVSTAAALDLCLLPAAALDAALRDRALQGLRQACGDGAELPLLRDAIAPHLQRNPEIGRSLLEGALSNHSGDAWLACSALRVGKGAERAEGWQRLARLANDPNVAAELSLHALRSGLLSRGVTASEEGLLRALQAAERAPHSLAAAVALDETLSSDDDAESRAVALFGRLAHASPEATKPLRAARARALLAAGRAREAVDEARRALSHDADDLGAWELLRLAGRALSDHAAVAEAAQRLADRAQGRFRALLLEEAALAFERELGQRDEAERCFRAAFEHDPTTEIGFTRLHDLLLERRDESGLLEVLERRISASEDPASRLDLRYECALILRAAGRKPEALLALRQVLAEDPEHVGAIGLLVETCTALEHWDEAVAALRKLADANVPTSQKRLARLGAAEFLERKLDDVEAACEELRALRAAGVDDTDVLMRLAGACERAGHYRQAVEAYRDAAARAQGPTRAELERLAGDVLRHHLGASNEAIEAYERALRAYALDEASCADLLELSESAEQRERILTSFEQAVRAALEREPARPELLRLLRRTGEWLGRKDVELTALSTLCALGLAESKEQRELETLAQSAHATGASALTDAALDRLSGSLSSTPMSRVAQLVAQGLATLEQAPAPVLQVDDGLRGKPATQRFEAGRRAMALRLGVGSLLARTRAARRDALRAGLALAGVAATTPEIEALGKQIGKQLVRAQRKELSRVGEQLEQPELQLDAYLDLLDLSLTRAGLLLADDLSSALQHTSGGAGTELETFAGAPRALDLLRFWLSPKLLELRREVGWGP